MLYINQNLNFAEQEHFKNIRYVIKRKLLGKEFKEPHPKGNKQTIRIVKDINPKVKDYFLDDDNLKNVLIGKPEILDGIKEMFSNKKEAINKLFNYDSFIKKDGTFHFYNAYHLAENLSINTCVYCNRIYTHTIINDKNGPIIRPTLDHWFPRSKFPLLALSFYNLIPSCSFCNSSVKGSEAMELNSFFHPYYVPDEEDRKMRFKFSYKLKCLNSVKCKVEAENEFSKNSIEKLKLEEIYAGHGEDIQDLLDLRNAYSDSYISSLQTILKTPMTKEEIFRLAFGVFLEEGKNHRRPLSKLKKDILIELGVLK